MNLMKLKKDIETSRPVGDVPKDSNEKSVQMLNIILANEFALFTKTLNYHWNVTGPRFHSLHNFLETQYNSLLEIMDDVAERIRVLGEKPIGTVEKMNSMSELSEHNKPSLDATEMLRDLLQDHMLIQNEIKEFLDDEEHLKKDFGTEDFLVGLLQKHEMTSWMLKSQIQ